MFKNLKSAWTLPVILLLAIGIYFVPPVHDRLAHRVDDLRTQIKYFFNPPEDAVFLPTQQAAIDAIVNATMQAHALGADAACDPARLRLDRRGRRCRAGR